MTGRDGTKGNKQSRNATVRRCGVVMGGAVGAFVAAAAMATGSAAPAKADIDALLDPIIQPLMTSFTDALAGFDPAAATDITSWTDSLLSSLNSLDLAVPSTAESAAAVAASSNSPVGNTYDIPITVAEGTEPTVQATVEGTTNTLLVDTGSSGLVLPWQSLGSNAFSALENLFSLGVPTGLSESGYSGGIDYLYLTYDNAAVDYGTNGTSVLDTTNTPLDVEILSWPTSFSAGQPLDFQQFLGDDQVTGILGIGDGVGPSTQSPLDAAGYTGVTVDVPKGEMIVEPTNAGTPIAGGTFNDTTNGAPITSLYETVTTGGKTLGASVTDDVDSGGVFGTIPSSIVGSSGSLPDGSVITVYSSQGGTELYQYTVESSSPVDQAPTAVSGTSIDSGYAPYNIEPIYINYTDNTLTFDQPGT